MTWRVVWSPQSRADLLAVGFEAAAGVGRAVLHWTERPPPPAPPPPPKHATKTPMDDDIALLTRWRAGDQGAGNALFKRCFDPLYRFFANKTRNPADVEDLMQKTFEVMVTSRDRFEGRSSVRTYLIGVAYNVLRKYYDALAKDRAVVGDSETSIADMGAGPHTHVECAERERILLDALRLIPVDLQIVLELYYLEGHRSESIAEILQINANTVRSRLQRGKERLGQRLAELMGTPPGIAGAAGEAGEDAWEGALRAIYRDDPDDPSRVA